MGGCSWWCIPLIPALERQRWTDLSEFKASLVYTQSNILKLCLRKRRRRRKRKSGKVEERKKEGREGGAEGKKEGKEKKGGYQVGNVSSAHKA